MYMPFENIQVPVPSNYDEVLKTIYGNYMAYPPVNERGAWHEGQITFDPDIPYQEFKNRGIQFSDTKRMKKEQRRKEKELRKDLNNMFNIW